MEEKLAENLEEIEEVDLFRERFNTNKYFKFSGY